MGQKHDIVFHISKRKWRNWYTRYFEVVVRVSSWGFKSPLSQIFL